MTKRKNKDIDIEVQIDVQSVIGYEKYRSWFVIREHLVEVISHQSFSRLFSNNSPRLRSCSTMKFLSSETDNQKRNF
jgi:hypothetical protein